MYITRIAIHKVVNVWSFRVRTYFKEATSAFVIGYEHNAKKKVKLKVLLNKTLIWYWIEYTKPGIVPESQKKKKGNRNKITFTSSKLS